MQTGRIREFSECLPVSPTQMFKISDRTIPDAGVPLRLQAIVGKVFYLQNHR